MTQINRSCNKYEQQGERIYYAEKKGLEPWLKENHGMTIRELLNFSFEGTNKILDAFEKQAK